MKFIRDNDFGGLAMIPLFVDWQIRRCNVKGCTNVPTTIITEDSLVIGICEEHFQESREKGEIEFTLEFDEFNAFEFDVLIRNKKPQSTTQIKRKII